VSQSVTGAEREQQAAGRASVRVCTRGSSATDCDCACIVCIVHRVTEQSYLYNNKVYVPKIYVHSSCNNI